MAWCSVSTISCGRADASPRARRTRAITRTSGSTTVPSATSGSVTLRGDAGDDKLVLPGTDVNDVFGVTGNSARNGGVDIAIESPGVRSVEVAGGAGDDRFELSALGATPDLYVLLDGGAYASSSTAVERPSVAIVHQLIHATSRGQ